MSPQLTPEQHDAVTAQAGRVVYFVDALTSEQFAVIPAKTFEKLQALFDPPASLAARDFYPLTDDAWRPILEDAALDAYAEELSTPSQR